MALKNKRKPVTRKLWKLLRYLPTPLRKRVIRSKFEISYDLSSDYVFKLAETEDEIVQAMQLVHESYIKLGYIDPDSNGLHFNAHLCLPNTSILIIKYNDEVVGTMSVVPDSPLGLPSEATWNLSNVKSESPRIAEVSALAIKRSHKTSKGYLLLTLCKFLFEYCTKTLEIDGVVFAATLEVEPFYTDVLLFKKVTAKTGQRHRLVKGNKSTCCFLDFNKVRKQYVKEYGWREKNKNLFHFFTEFISPNILLPGTNKISAQGLLYQKNVSLVKVLRKAPSLRKKLSSDEQKFLANLDPNFTINHVANVRWREGFRNHAKLAIRNLEAQLIVCSFDRACRTILTNVSLNGFGLKLADSKIQLKNNTSCTVVFDIDGKSISIKAALAWVKDATAAFEVSRVSELHWRRLVNAVYQEPTFLDSASGPAKVYS